jgi:hypothetical protein
MNSFDKYSSKEYKGEKRKKKIEIFNYIFAFSSSPL